MTSPIQPKHKSRKALYAIALALATLIIAVLAFVIVQRDSGSTETKKANNSTTSTTIKSRNDRNTTTTTVKLSDSQQGEYSTEFSIKPFSSGGVSGNSSLPTFDESGQDYAIDQLVPTITAQNFDGDTVTVAAGKQPMMLVFVAHWCPHCQNEVPVIVRLYKEGKIPSDVKLVAIATGTDQNRPNYPPSKWLEEEKWPGEVIVDTVRSDIAKAFGLPGYPYVVYVSSEGTVSMRTSGEQEESQIEKNAKAISLLESA